MHAAGNYGLFYDRQPYSNFHSSLKIQQISDFKSFEIKKSSINMTELKLIAIFWQSQTKQYNE